MYVTAADTDVCEIERNESFWFKELTLLKVKECTDEICLSVACDVTKFQCKSHTKTNTHIFCLIISIFN